MLWSKGCGFAGWGSGLRRVGISYIIAKLGQGCQNRLVHIIQGPRHPLVPSFQMVLQCCVSCCCSWKSVFQQNIWKWVFPSVMALPRFQQRSAALTLTLHEAFPVANHCPSSQHWRKGQEGLCSYAPEVSLLELFTALTTFHKFFKVKNRIELHLESSSILKEVVAACK